MTVSVERNRLRVLILCYDSAPIQELLWPLADDLAAQAECLFLCQFPATLRSLRERGFQARSIRSVLGWEHGNPVPEVGPTQTLIPLENAVEYECLLTPGQNHTSLVAHADGIVRRFKALTDSWQPSLVLAWNGHTLPFKPCVEFARRQGIPVRLLERGFFPGALFVDRQGTNAMSAVKNRFAVSTIEDELRIRSYIENHIRHYTPIVEQASSSVDSAASLRYRCGFTQDSFLLFVPEQLDHDSNTVLFCRS